jgi:hypothetical protein
MTFARNLDERCAELEKELPGDFKRQDHEEGTQNAKEFNDTVELLTEENIKYLKAAGSIMGTALISGAAFAVRTGKCVIF